MLNETGQSQESEAALFELTSSASTLLETTPNDIEPINNEEILAGGGRWLVGFTGKERGFFKYARTPETSILLQQEMQANQLLADLNIPRVNALRAYQEDSRGRGIFMLQRLESDDGVFLSNQESIAQAPANLGARAARGLLQIHRLEIPQTSDTTLLENRTWEHTRGFWINGDSWQPTNLAELELEREWQQSVIFDERYSQFRDSLVERETLNDLFRGTWEQARPFLSRDEEKGGKFLAHMDPKPENTWFPHKGSQENSAIILDWELARVVHNQSLAKIIDYGLFYSKSSANPELQQQFLTTILEESPTEKRGETHALLRAAAVYGTMLFTKFSFLEDQERPVETKRSVPLLLNLGKNLAALDAVYAGRKNNEQTDAGVQ